MSETPVEPSFVEQGQEWVGTLSEAMALSMQVWERLLLAQAEGGGRIRNPDPLNTSPTFTKLARTMWAHPREMAELTTEYWTAQNTLWQQSCLAWLGARDGGEISLPHMRQPDKRFSHKAWSENPFFNYLKQQYLLNAGWLLDAVGSVGEMEPAERKKATFYTRAYVEAMNPANFFALNPEVLETTLRERGQNLVRGLRMMLEDLERGQGKIPRPSRWAATPRSLRAR
jgi:polyhydroxyalkanoate synthase